MKEALSPQALSTLIGSIYDCALDPGRWPDALAGIRGDLHFANAAMGLLALPSQDMILEIFNGPEPQWIARAPQYGADVIDQWGGSEKIFSLPLDAPIVLSRVRPRAEWADNRFYREWGRPQGIHDVMAVVLARDPTMLGSLAFGRHEAMGDIGDHEIDAAQLLLPHLQRAVAIGRLLDIRSVVSSTVDATLDLLTVAVVLIDADLHIVHANTAARTILAMNTAIRSQRGRLTVRPIAVEAALGAAVRQAAEDETQIGRRGFGIRAVDPDGAPRVLHVLPLRHGVLRPGLAPGAVAAIFITPAISPPPPPMDALAALFDLTPSEARVFSHIASGMTRPETAKALGIEVTTIKAHLSHVFFKTGTRRQADLVALNAAMALPLPQ